MTKVINLFGGSGLGKSTTAAGLFYEMKLRGIHCELVREYVKNWAWEGRHVGAFDQVYIFGKQAKTEARLYGKVDVIVTDSPLLLSPIYETFYSGQSIVKPSVLNFLEFARQKEVQHFNFILKRNKPFDTRGRFETEEQAKSVDVFVDKCLEDWGINTTTVDCDDRQRVEEIIKAVMV